MVRRGELSIAEVPHKRPGLVLTRNGVIHAQNLISVAEITTSVRGLGTEVDFDPAEAGLDRPSVINCDGLHTVEQVAKSGPVGQVSDETMRKVSSAINYALGVEQPR